MVMIAAPGGAAAYGTFGEADKPAASRATLCCWRGEARPEKDWVRCQRRGVLRRAVVASCGLALFVCAVFAAARWCTSCTILYGEVCFCCVINMLVQ